MDLLLCYEFVFWAFFPSGGTDGYLIDREIIDLVNKLKGKRNTTPVIEILNLGFNPLWVGYHRPKAGKDKSRWTMRKKWKLCGYFFFHLPMALYV